MGQGNGLWSASGAASMQHESRVVRSWRLNAHGSLAGKLSLLLDVKHDFLSIPGYFGDCSIELPGSTNGIGGLRICAFGYEGQR
jgi:hypothetical protein